ncbi:MAG: dockerin type I repeat-containing protein, partial [Ruminococcus sp.]
GEVSVVDVVYLNKYLANIIVLNNAAMANADCCDDGIINTSDSMALLKFLVNKLESLPMIPE